MEERHHLRKYRHPAAFRNEEQQRTRVVAELRTSRLSGIRVAVPVEAVEARLGELDGKGERSSR